MSLFDKLGKSTRNKIKNVGTLASENTGAAKKRKQTSVFVSSNLSDKFDFNLLGAQIGVNTAPADDNPEPDSRIIQNAGRVGQRDFFGGGSSAGSTSTAEEDSPDPSPTSETLISLDPSSEPEENGTEEDVNSALFAVLSDPIGTLDEVSKGVILGFDDKPYVVGILENEIVRGGFPKEAVLFIKRVSTSKFKEIRYTILRKALFFENQYFQVATIEGAKIRLEEKYRKFAENNFSVSPKQMITFVDTNLLSNHVYAYKIKAEFRELTEREKRKREQDLARIRDVVQSNPGIVARNVFINFDGGE